MFSPKILLLTVPLLFVPLDFVPAQVESLSQSETEKEVVLIGAGDIADCTDLAGAEATAKLLEANPGTVMALGDLAYPNGTAEDFKCYDKTWGRVKTRTRPAVGNHEFHSTGASYYFQYFGAAAGDAKTGYYSYELGSWHIVVLNSECLEIGGCGAGSPEEKWLRADLAAHPVGCTLAYFHKPRFSSGLNHGNDPEVGAFWQALYDFNAELILNGHDHDYERFAPQDPNGNADPKRGIREFVVGTGGKNHREFGIHKANSEVRNNTAFGVLKLTLKPTGYDWKFIPEAGKSFTDSGSGSCH
ncbi:MAG TPA: metallophosphoesterase [Candidatus Baltobacteraceae bacterium]|nr:metallophosphoesterase [Candidatus Baltobacteraceae bacterium]